MYMCIHATCIVILYCHLQHIYLRASSIEEKPHRTDRRVVTLSLDRKLVFKSIILLNI